MTTPPQLNQLIVLFVKISTSGLQTVDASSAENLLFDSGVKTVPQNVVIYGYLLGLPGLTFCLIVMR